MKVLVTGALGFIGLESCRYYKSKGNIIYGLGHGDINSIQTNQIIDHWINDDISIESLLKFKTEFELIIHCGGSGSVGFSKKNPYEDYHKTVNSTIELLEFIRIHSPSTYLIYPSSPAVQGEHNESPIFENYIGKPKSPYGYHKKIAEELCESYSVLYNLKIGIVRLFSVYGNGLKKQLLWDTIQKLTSNNLTAEFWGTGEETRDFIHISDVINIFDALFSLKNNLTIINGGTGSKIKIKDLVNKIDNLVKSNKKIIFNNIIDEGNPKHYCASTKELNKIYNCNFKSLHEGIEEYYNWTNEQRN